MNILQELSKSIPTHEDLERHLVVTLSDRIDERCKKEGKDTFTFKMLREEKTKMYKGKQ